MSDCASCGWSGGGLPVYVLVGDDEKGKASLLVESSLVFKSFRLVLGLLHVGGYGLNSKLSAQTLLNSRLT